MLVLWSRIDCSYVSQLRIWSKACRGEVSVLCVFKVSYIPVQHHVVTLLLAHEENIMRMVKILSYFWLQNLRKKDLERC